MQKNLYRFDVDVISTEHPTIGKCKKAMKLTLERDLDLHVGNSEPQDVEQPHVEDHGVGTATCREILSQMGKGSACSYTTR